jgi:hypothetical protein
LKNGKGVSWQRNSFVVGYAPFTSRTFLTFRRLKYGRFIGWFMAPLPALVDVEAVFTVVEHVGTNNG